MPSPKWLMQNPKGIYAFLEPSYSVSYVYSRDTLIHSGRVVATVGGAGRWSPPLTSEAHHEGLKSRLEPTTQPQKTYIFGQICPLL